MSCGRGRCGQGDNTALHWAAMRGHVEIVNVLVAAGAEKTIRNKQDLMPARAPGSITAVRWLHASCVPLLWRPRARAQIDLCQPVWSISWRYVAEVLAY